VAAVVAHEYGHIAQFKHNLKRTLLAGQDTVKRLELHADFLAGYFAGRRKLDRPDFPAAVFATTQYSAGDHRTERLNHHGTPDERAGAIVKGFEAAFRDRRSPNEALQIGVRYAQTL
jgi:predicted metalloprotease